MKAIVTLTIIGLLASGCCSVCNRAKRTDVVTMKGSPVTLLGPDVATGTTAPEFKVVDSQFKPVKLSDFSGKVILISAVPSIDTPVCSIQTARFNEEVSKLPSNVVALTISADLPFAQKRYCAAKGIDKMQVLSDAAWNEFGLRYGIRIEGRGLLARSVWVIGPYGLVRYRQIVPELTNEPDYAAALDAVRKLAAK